MFRVVVRAGAYINSGVVGASKNPCIFSNRSSSFMKNSFGIRAFSGSFTQEIQRRHQERLDNLQIIEFEKVEKIVQHVFDHATNGDPQSVIKTIDELPAPLLIMHVEDNKTQTMERIIKTQKPQNLVELGGYFGYSAIRLAFAARKHNPNAHYYTVEINPILSCVIESLVRFAGLNEAITVLPGNLAENIPILKNKILDKSNSNQIDFLLLDHWKEEYVPDLQLAQKEGFLKKGSVIVADNIFFPGAPEYKKYMETETTLYSSTLLPYDNDAILVSLARRVLWGGPMSSV